MDVIRLIWMTCAHRLRVWRWRASFGVAHWFHFRLMAGCFVPSIDEFFEYHAARRQAISDRYLQWLRVQRAKCEGEQ